ncbi:hypothetical protein Tco_1211098 [Tanacetum coccineum]
MVALKFAFLDKPTESDRFEQIVDFLNAYPIKYALTVNPTIYTSCIEQLWTTAKVKTVNGEVQIQALVDKKKVINTETSIRSDLQIEDAEEPVTDDIKNMASVPTHSNNPLPSGEDRLKLNELMELYTSLSQRVLDLEKTKTSQAVKITKLKKKVKKMEKKGGSRTHRLRRLYKVVESSEKWFPLKMKVGYPRGCNKLEQDMHRKGCMLEKMFSTADPVTTTGEVVTTANVVVSTAEVTTDSTTTTTEVAQKLQAQLDAELEEEEKLAIQREEDANIPEWDDVQAMMVKQIIAHKRKKHFVRLRAEEQRRKPPTKAQTRNKMYTYLKNMAGFTHNQLKNKSFDEVQKAFDKTMGWIDSFVSMDSEVVKGGKEKDEGSVTRAEESSSKRAGTELEQERIKKQKIDDDQEEDEMKKHMEIVIDEEEIAVDAIPLATKPPIIVDWKIIKEGTMGYFQLIRADGSSRRYSSMIKILQNIDREDLEILWKLVKAEHVNTRLEEAYERVLWGDLKVMFKPDVESKVWRNLQGYNVTVWKLFSSSGVHFVRFQNLHIFMLVEKKSRHKYPLEFGGRRDTFIGDGGVSLCLIPAALNPRGALIYVGLLGGGDGIGKARNLSASSSKRNGVGAWGRMDILAVTR